MAEEVRRIEAARSILIIGGGAVGVEVAGELVAKFTDPATNKVNKRIVLISRS